MRQQRATAAFDARLCWIRHVLIHLIGRGRPQELLDKKKRLADVTLAASNYDSDLLVIFSKMTAGIDLHGCCRRSGLGNMRQSSHRLLVHRLQEGFSCRGCEHGLALSSLQRAMKAHAP